MAEYRVTWSIDVTADTAKEAAMIALHYQRDIDSTATVFDVQDEHDNTTQIDLFETELDSDEA